MADNVKSEVSGKLAFMFPSLIDQKNEVHPTLNFIAKKYLSMGMGVSLIDLDLKEKYLIIFELIAPDGEVALTSNGLSEIPNSEIDPQWKTSYLLAKFYFEVKKFGTYTFKCSLVSHTTPTDSPLDHQEIRFNIVNGEVYGGNI